MCRLMVPAVLLTLAIVVCDVLRKALYPGKPKLFGLLTRTIIIAVGVLIFLSNLLVDLAKLLGILEGEWGLCW